MTEIISKNTKMATDGLYLALRFSTLDTHICNSLLFEEEIEFNRKV